MQGDKLRTAQLGKRFCVRQVRARAWTGRQTTRGRCRWC